MWFFIKSGYFMTETTSQSFFLFYLWNYSNIYVDFFLLQKGPHGTNSKIKTHTNLQVWDLQVKPQFSVCWFGNGMLISETLKKKIDNYIWHWISIIQKLIEVKIICNVLILSFTFTKRHTFTHIRCSQVPLNKYHVSYIVCVCVCCTRQIEGC